MQYACYHTAGGAMDEETQSAKSPTDRVAERKFQALSAQWRQGTDHLSTMTDIVLHHAHLQIIGMGDKALPYILRELSEGRQGHWFTALSSITGESVASDDMSYDEAVRAWLQWGHNKGYLGDVS